MYEIIKNPRNHIHLKVLQILTQDVDGARVSVRQEDEHPALQTLQVGGLQGSWGCGGIRHRSLRMVECSSVWLLWVEGVMRGVRVRVIAAGGVTGGHAHPLRSCWFLRGFSSR